MNSVSFTLPKITLGCGISRKQSVVFGTSAQLLMISKLFILSSMFGNKDLIKNGMFTVWHPQDFTLISCQTFRSVAAALRILCLRMCCKTKRSSLSSPIQKNQNLYDDRLCFFRCMATHQKGTLQCVEAHARALFHQWTDTSVDDFEGVTLRELDELEDVFRVAINVFEFRYDPLCLIPH
ncbi:hypothetical protein ElyMa_003404300 [Elysia marginata]|uniref:Uncharacterized protein n=1 Tax=Elysia marginata TaxID=1093978 RepID=A0AAV4JNY2_9GAST|nr:hypothetical protein ElyMa_003404300 [Elysia marginata]